MKSPFALALTVASLTVGAAARADVIFDGSTGPAGAATGPNYVIDASEGTTAGNNLFHSFTSFNVNTGETVTFTGPGTIDNVISRVTGPGITTIDGMLRNQVGTSNFYFINPNGVVFGQNAAVDVPAGFHVSTANELRFPAGQVLKASLGPGSTFSSATPQSFGFLGAPSGNITFDHVRNVVPGASAYDPVTDRLNTKLRFGANSNVSFTAANILFIDSDMEARGPRVDFVAVGTGANDVSLNTFALQNAPTGVFDYTLSQFLHVVDDTVPAYSAVVDVQAGTVLFGVNDQARATSFLSGFFRIVPGGHNITSLFQSHARGDADGADLSFSAQNIFIDSFGAYAGISPQGPGYYIQIATSTHFGLCTPCSLADRLVNTGRAGDIALSATGQIVISDAAEVISGSFTAGDGGDISLTAPIVQLTNFAGVYNYAGAFGDTGSISITGDQVGLTNNAFVKTQNEPSLSGIPLSQFHQNFLPAGNAGAVDVNASTSLNVRTGSSISSVASEGNSGKVSLESPDIVIGDLGVAVYYQTTQLFGLTVALNPLGTFSTIPQVRSLVKTRGQGGDVEVTGQSVVIQNGGILSSESGISNFAVATFTPFYGATFAPALGSGEMHINADVVTVTGVGHGQSTGALPSNFVHDGRVPSAIASNAGSNSGGPAGNVDITANIINIFGGAVVAATTNSPGNAGAFTLTADELHISGSPPPALAALPFYDFGAGYLNLFTNSALLADTLSSGNAGSFLIFADTVDVSDGGQILSRTSGSGLGGIIIICNAHTFIADGANSGLITSSQTGSSGDAGLIIVQADHATISNGAQVNVETDGTGAGGQILIQAHDFNAHGGAGINTLTGASAASGAGAGRIAIEAGHVSLTDGAVITTSSQGLAPAGKVQIRTAELTITGAGTAISSSAAAGDAGSIEIGTVNFTLGEGASWSTLASAGAGGDIIIDWNGVGTIEDSSVTTNVLGGPGGGGSILLGTGPLAALNLSAVCMVYCQPFNPFANVAAYNPANSGHGVLILDNATLDATAEQGPGGIITIGSDVTLLANGDLPSDLDASSAFGPDGVVKTVEPFSVPEIVVVPERVVTTRCAAQHGGGSALADGLTGHQTVEADPLALAPALYSDILGDRAASAHAEQHASEMSCSKVALLARH